MPLPDNLQDNSLYRLSFQAYTPGTHARKDEDVLLLELPGSPTRTHTV
jgi:hypothetical protein